jgi:hypothetical protein
MYRSPRAPFVGSFGDDDGTRRSCAIPSWDVRTKGFTSGVPVDPERKTPARSFSAVAKVATPSADIALTP